MLNPTKQKREGQGNMSIDKLHIGNHSLLPGTTTQLEIPVAKLYTDTDISMPVHVIRGKKTGPTLFVSAAVHGNELNGIEIIRRLIHSKQLRITHGTLILVPMVNVYGVLNQSRYMPDRRDLNRMFPGSAKGSLAGRLADIFLNQIVKQSHYGIDLHTGAINRSNLPQIRANLDNEETAKLAKTFGVPVVLNSNILDGSLRQAAVELGTKILVYEAGEALRFDELCIRLGIKGILNILSHLGMGKKRLRKQTGEPFVAYTSHWLRAASSGIVRDFKQLGAKVQKNDVLAEIGDPFGKIIDSVITKREGIIIGKQNIPLVQEGDAMFHIAYFKDDSDDVVEHIESMHDTLLPDEEFSNLNDDE